MLLVYKRWQSGDHVRNIASRDEYVPQHGSRYKTKGTSSRGLAGARIRVRKIAAIGMLTSAVIILGITVKTYASERTGRPDASTVQLQNEKVSKSKASADQALSTADLKTRLSKATSTISLRVIPFGPSRWWITRLLPWRMRALPRSRMPCVGRRSWATWV